MAGINESAARIDFLMGNHMATNHAIAVVISHICSREAIVLDYSNVRGQGARHLVEGTLDPIAGIFH